MEPHQRAGDRYRLEKQLFAGDFFSVYHAVDQRTGDRVMAHLYAAGMSWQDDPRLDPQLRINKLAELLSDLSHPHLCPPIDHAALDDGRIAIIYPWVEGQRLDQRLIADPLTPSNVLQLGINLCAALHTLHARGIVHRDIKPRNVILSASGAVLVGLEWAQTPLDLHASGPAQRHPGTQAYMSPEQAGTTGPLDSRSDLYSLGVVLSEALTGSPKATTSDVQRGNLRGYGPLGRILQRASHPDPSRRFQTARELQADLEALAEGSLTSRVGLLLRQSTSMTWAARGLALLAVLWSLAGLGGASPSGSPPIALREKEHAAPIAWRVVATAAPSSWAATSAQDEHPEAAMALEAKANQSVAPELRVGQFMERAFQTEDDVHHASIRVAGGRNYMIATANLAPGVDTHLDVSYNGQRVTNDDAWPGTLASQVFVSPAQDATIWVQVTNRGASGRDATYELVVVEVEPTPTPTASPTATLTPRADITMTPRPTYTPRPAATSSPIATRTPRPTITRRATYTPRPTMSPTPSRTPTAVNTPRPTATATPPRTVLPVKTATTPVW